PVRILAGTNDIAGNAGPVSLESIEQNLATMAELAKLHGIRVVLASLLPVSDDKRDADGRPLLRTQDRPTAKLRALNGWMQDYARRNGHVYLDYFSAAAAADGLLKPELRSEEHTSELQSRVDLVCRLLLEKKNNKQSYPNRDWR